MASGDVVYESSNASLGRSSKLVIPTQGWTAHLAPTGTGGTDFPTVDFSVEGGVLPAGLNTSAQYKITITEV